MARRLRLDLPGEFYHVTARGNDRQPIFLEDADYRFYLAHLKLLLHALGIELHGYCLMPNHIHLLLKTLHGSLSRLMQRQQGWYARRFNAKYGRTGHLFERRFDARLIVDDAYLMEVLRYIHMNPVKALLVGRPEDYPWSSVHAYLTGKADGLVTVSEGLAFFEGDVRRFRDFTVARHEVAVDAEGWPTTIWYRPTLLEVESCGVPERAIELMAKVGSAFAVPAQAIAAGGRQAGSGEARAAAMLLLRMRTALSLRDIALAVGLRQPTVVCNRIAWLLGRAERSAALRAVLDRLGILDELREQGRLRAAQAQT